MDMNTGLGGFAAGLFGVIIALINTYRQKQDKKMMEQKEKATADTLALYEKQITSLGQMLERCETESVENNAKINNLESELKAMTALNNSAISRMVNLTSALEAALATVDKQEEKEKEEKDRELFSGTGSDSSEAKSTSTSTSTPAIIKEKET